MREKYTWRQSGSPAPPHPRHPDTAPANGQRQPLVLTSDRRSYIARIVYPELSAEEAGKQVAHDIRSCPSLLAALRQVGYRSGVQGYTPQQIRILLKYYHRI